MSNEYRRIEVITGEARRRLLSEGGAAAVESDEPVVGTSEVRKFEDRIRELERMLGRKTLEAEILREALAKANSKKPILQPVLTVQDEGRGQCSGRFALEPRRAFARHVEAARFLSQGGGC